MSAAPSAARAAIADELMLTVLEHLVAKHPEPEQADSDLSTVRASVRALAQRCAEAEAASAVLAHAYAHDSRPPAWALDHGIGVLQAQRAERVGSPGAASENATAGRGLAQGAGE